MECPLAWNLLRSGGLFEPTSSDELRKYPVDFYHLQTQYPFPDYKTMKQKYSSENTENFTNRIGSYVTTWSYGFIRRGVEMLGIRNIGYIT